MVKEARCLQLSGGWGTNVRIGNRKANAAKCWWWWVWVKDYRNLCIIQNNYFFYRSGLVRKNVAGKRSVKPGGTAGWVLSVSQPKVLSLPSSPPPHSPFPRSSSNCWARLLEKRNFIAQQLVLLLFPFQLPVIILCSWHYNHHHEWLIVMSQKEDYDSNEE